MGLTIITSFIITLHVFFPFFTIHICTLYRILVKIIFITLVFLIPGARVPPYLQVLLALAAMATGSHQVVVADCFDVSQKLVSQCLARVARAIAGLVHQSIKFPNGGDLQKVTQDFYTIAGMPGVIGCVDCTHVPIVRPTREDSELFRCRKGYFSLNIQAICGPDLKFYNIVARWPGSVHDARIF